MKQDEYKQIIEYVKIYEYYDGYLSFLCIHSDDNRMFLNDVSYSNLLGFKETIIDFVFSAIPKHSENSGSELSDEDLNKARDRTVIQIGSINQQGDIEYFKKTVTYGM